MEVFTAISLLSRSALRKGNESLAFKESAESITRLTINADLFTSRSNNCRNHTDFQKNPGRVLIPETEKRTTALSRACG